MVIPRKVRDRIVARLYQEGRAVKEIMEATAIRCPNTLYKILKANGIPLRRSRTTTPIDELVGPLSYLLFEEGKEPEQAAIELKQPLALIMQVIDERM